MLVVREDYVRADEDAVFDDRPVEDRAVVLDLDLVPDPNPEIHVDVLTEDALLSDLDILPNLALVPDLGAVADLSLRAHFGRRVNP
jgi:hypothetical protein